MNSLLLAVGCALAYVIAYKTYGRFLARRIFNIQPDSPTPAHVKADGTDYVPTKKEILFGHHYTSIAGTGPIVGPAIGVIWGWLPALLWVVFGCIFMGAVHDFGAIMVSIRHEGRSIGDIAGDLISPRVRIIFLIVIALLLMIVIAVFCLVIATLFNLYPQSVLSIWLEVPIAVWLGYMIYRRGKPALPYSLIGLALLYFTIWLGTQMPLVMPAVGPIQPAVTWTVILLIYAFIASTLPVTRLLQPRDYINGHELFVVMGVLSLAVLVARPEIVAPAINTASTGAPALWPMLFVVIACGAISGFHSLVASGTTSKQLSAEDHARTIGYGSMLAEGMLAVLVIVAVSAGIGLAVSGQTGSIGRQAWLEKYGDWNGIQGLGPPVKAFVQGSANMLAFLGIPVLLGQAIMGVFVASFAGTTLDTATRLQRYVVSELASGLKLKPLAGKYAATTIAVLSAGVLALSDGEGKGGMMLWPLFGAVNQLLAALALLVVSVYLVKTAKPLVYTFIPFVFMAVMTGWAMVIQIKQFYAKEQLSLMVISAIIIAAEIWMIAEAAIVLNKARALKTQPATE